MPLPLGCYLVPLRLSKPCSTFTIKAFSLLIPITFNCAIRLSLHFFSFQFLTSHAYYETPKLALGLSMFSSRNYGTMDLTHSLAPFLPVFLSWWHIYHFIINFSPSSLNAWEGIVQTARKGKILYREVL